MPKKKIMYSDKLEESYLRIREGMISWEFKGKKDGGIKPHIQIFWEENSEALIITNDLLHFAGIIIQFHTCTEEHNRTIRIVIATN